MAEIVAGLGCSHAPSIAHAYDAKKTGEPEWKPLFDAFDHAEKWLRSLRLDAMICIYNDHIDQFFLDSWPQFAIGTGESFAIADEGWSPRPFPPVPGHPSLATHLAAELVADGIDVSVAYEQVVDHGILSPLPVIESSWAVPIVPIAVNVIWDPRPGPARCWRLGEALGAAIASFDPAMRVAVIGTGGLSHQLTGSDFGVIREDWDLEFLRLIEHEPEALTRFSLDDFAQRGGEHSVEIVQWIAMRAALPKDSRVKFSFYYPHQIMGYGLVGFLPPSTEPAAH